MKDPFKKVISKFVEVDSNGIVFKDPNHKLTKRELSAILAHIDAAFGSSLFATADACRLRYDALVDSGLHPDAALMQLSKELAGSKVIGARKGFFALKRIGVLIRMSSMFPMEFRHLRVHKTHYEVLACSKHVSPMVAQGRIAQLIDAIENPDPDNPVDTTVQGTRDIVAAELPEHARVTPKALMPVKKAVSGLRKLFKTDKAFTCIGKALLNKAITVSAEMFAVYVEAQARALVQSADQTAVKTKSVKVQVRKVKSGNTKVKPKAKAKQKAKKAHKKAGKRKGK